MCSADGSPLEFRIATTHVFKKDSPERYAEAKAKLLKNHRHPWFKLLNGICRMPETDRELFRDFSVKDVNRMACWVWERVADQDKSFRAYAFSVIMCLLEGRLAIESLVEQARNGMLPERLKPASFVFNELKPNIKQLLAESSLIKTTPVMRSRFKNPTGVTHCFPLFKQAVGTLACVAPHDPEVLKHRPAYFVLQTSNGWKLYFSDIRDDKPEFVDIAWKLKSMGYKLYGTSGTCAWLNKHMVPCNEVRNMSGESPNIVDLLQSGLVDYVFSTSARGRDPHRDSVRLRRKAVELSIPCITAVDTANALVNCLRSEHSLKDVPLVDIATLYQGK